LEVERGIARADLQEMALKRGKVKRFLSDRLVKDVYLVGDRLINFATEPKPKTP